MGDITRHRSDHEAARKHYEEALSLYRRHDDEGARKLFDQALPLHRQTGNVLGEANCIESLGDLALLERTDHEGARKRYEEALSLYRRVGDVLGEANCNLRLGDLARRRREVSLAQNKFEQAWELYRTIPEPYSIGVTFERLARIEHNKDKQAALRAEAVSAWTQIGRHDLIDELRREFPEAPQAVTKPENISQPPQSP